MASIGPTIATGQVATSATALMPATSTTQNAPSVAALGGGHVALSFYNNSVTKQTLTVTYQQLTPSGLQTSVKLGQFSLSQGFSAVMSGVPLGTGDVILAQTTTASVLDFQVNVQNSVLAQGSSSVPLQYAVYDSTGALVTNASTDSIVANTITSSSANALAVGPNGVTNPTFNVDASTASAATGFNVKSAAAAGGVARRPADANDPGTWADVPIEPGVARHGTCRLRSPRPLSCDASGRSRRW